jgi:hypothetical protein
MTILLYEIQYSHSSTTNACNLPFQSCDQLVKRQVASVKQRGLFYYIKISTPPFVSHARRPEHDLCGAD